MKTTLPVDCENSPGTTLIIRVVTHWAAGEAASMVEFLTDDIAWKIVGNEHVYGKKDLGELVPSSDVEALNVTSIVTHGRLGSCDGYLKSSSGYVAFSHIFRFGSGTERSAIKAARTYLINDPAK